MSFFSWVMPSRAAKRAIRMVLLKAAAALLALAAITSANAWAVPVHVETWAGYMYGGKNEGHMSPPSTMRAWATYVESSNDGRPASYAVCNIVGHPCRSVAYVNTDNQYFGSCGWSDAVVNGGLSQQTTLAESSWLHATPVQTYFTRLFNKYSDKCVSATRNTGLWVNKKSIAGARNALAYFNAYFQHEFRTGVPDFYLNDDVNVINSFGGRPAAEYRSWVDKQSAQAQWLSHQVNSRGTIENVFFNGCFTSPWVQTNITLIKLRPNIVGCENEGGVGFENLKNGHAVYMLDNCARVSLNPNGGIFLNGPDTDGGLIGRRQSTAFNWLCYVPAGRVVQWEEEEWGSPYVNLFPEEGIYMTRPLQSMLAPGACPDSTISAGGAGNDGTSGLPCRIHGHNDLMVLGSSPLPVERREFAQCYNRARLIGVCGVIWNMTPFPVTVGSGWLRQKYAHTMTMHRGTIDEGGTVTFDARVTPAGTIIPAYDALFLFQ